MPWALCQYLSNPPNTTLSDGLALGCLHVLLCIVDAKIDDVAGLNDTSEAYCEWN